MYLNTQVDMKNYFAMENIQGKWLIFISKTETLFCMNVTLTYLRIKAFFSQTE